MSNCLVITITEFRSVSGSQYGYRASDSYGQLYDDSYESWDTFYAAYPTKEALVGSIVELDMFSGIEYNSDNHTVSCGATSLYIEGFNPSS